MSDIVRKHIVLTGSVQGVGLRWRASLAASLFDCTGWVMNEWDGSVTLELQGTEENISSVLAAMQDSGYIWFDTVNVSRIPVVEHERGFRTKYY